jgi:hypothetical protein
MSEAHNKYVPAAFFGIVLGLAGLGTSWRIAASLWPVPQSIGAAITLTAVAVWAVLIILYASKWIWAPAEGIGGIPSPGAVLFRRRRSGIDGAHRSCDPALRPAHSGGSRGAIGPIPLAAPYVLIAVSLTIGGIAVGTLWLLLRGRLLPPPLQPARESLHPTARVI